MTAEQFTYWLQGFMETADPKSIDEKQTQIIKDHLALVFTKVTPDYHFTPIPPDFGTIKDYNPQPTQPYPYEWNPNRIFIC